MTDKHIPATRRADVEGLRGVAVFLVVVFHIWVGTVSGGVDAFLFISGFFLIPSLIKAQTGDAPVNNPLPRLWRVLKRLWLPMAATVAVTVLATWFVYPSTRRSETLIDGVWSDLWAVNWTFALNGRSYTAASAMPSPFQHLWSLAVQAQIFALLIVGITLAGLGLRTLARRAGTTSADSRVRRSLIGLVVAVTVASFVYANVLAHLNQTLNYYDTFARFWEISLGGLLGLVLTGRVVTGWIRQIAGVVGLIMLGITGLVVNGTATFPGWQALLPVGGAILVFVAGTGGTSVVSRILSTRPLVYLGTIAYHLYLWHWPILIMYIVYRNYHASPIKSVSLAAGTAIIVVSLLVASAAHFVFKPDSPILKYRVRTPIVIAGTVAAVVVAVQAWTAPAPEVSASPVDPVQHPGAAAYADGAPVPDGVPFVPTLAASRADLPATGLTGCMNDGQKNSDVVACDYGAKREPGRKVLMLVGGSHAEHFLPALDQIGKKNGFTVSAVIMAGCRMAAGPDAAESSESPRCLEWQRKVMDYVVAQRPDAVFTNATRPGNNWGDPDQTPQFYIDVFKRFSDAGLTSIGVRDLPWLMDQQGNTREPFDCMAVKNDANACGVSRSFALAPQNPADAALGGLPGVHNVDFTDLHCNATWCPVVVGNVLVYRDSNHFTGTFMRTMAPYIERQLAAVEPWLGGQN
ncbi:MAG: acyltransferase family protein [Gordonia sp. (in: high G+C Gram-positive bacteria)]|uniref:acyltransferase family protein n=1 Tax=Gordonia sp. (in: high G+C Gram-positive bacteria) TaxID=84139 RepID=UPI0039E3F6ED